MNRRNLGRDGKKPRKVIASGKRNRQHVAAEQAKKREKKRSQKLAARFVPGGLSVDISKLAPHSSYSQPEFVKRGYYVAQSFVCLDCGASQVWTPSQQKWWYEVAKGDPFTTARRCRACRRKERTRREEARRVHEEGVARKRQRQE